jgi:hypothetical protein
MANFKKIMLSKISSYFSKVAHNIYLKYFSDLLNGGLESKFSFSKKVKALTG